MKALRILMIAVILSAAWNAAGFAGGDEIEMRDGTRVKGDIIAQNSSQLYLSTAEGLKKIDTINIRTIHFGSRPPGTPLVTSSINQGATSPDTSVPNGTKPGAEPGLTLSFKKE